MLHGEGFIVDQCRRSSLFAPRFSPDPEQQRLADTDNTAEQAAEKGRFKKGLYQGTTLVVPIRPLYVCHPEPASAGEGSAFPSFTTASEAAPLQHWETAISSPAETPGGRNRALRLCCAASPPTAHLRWPKASREIAAPACNRAESGHYHSAAAPAGFLPPEFVANVAAQIRIVRRLPWLLRQSMRCSSRCSANRGRRRKRFNVDSFIRSTSAKRMWLATSAVICLVSSLEKCSRWQISLRHTHAHLDVAIEADAVGRDAEGRRLADIVQQRPPGQCARTSRRQFFQQQQGVNPDIALGMKLRRLLDARACDRSPAAPRAAARWHRAIRTQRGRGPRSASWSAHRGPAQR